MQQESYKDLRRFAADIRINTLISMYHAGGGHVGGAMSLADVLAVLYGKIMVFDPEQPRLESRDRLVISKGHSGPAQYAALAIKGFFPLEELKTLNVGGTRLPSHCDRLLTPGIDMTAGSLGQGLSCACGMAYALKLKGSTSRVFSIIGDGEMQEGQIWEAIQFAAHHKLSNLVTLVDNNQKQLDAPTKEIVNPFDLEEKLTSFGLECKRATAYDVESVYNAINASLEDPITTQAIILDGYKGIGCNFAEEADFNHFMSFDKEQLDSAVAEIERRFVMNRVGEDFLYE